MAIMLGQPLVGRLLHTHHLGLGRVPACRRHMHQPFIRINPFWELLICVPHINVEVFWQPDGVTHKPRIRLIHHCPQSFDSDRPVGKLLNDRLITCNIPVSNTLSLVGKFIKGFGNKIPIAGIVPRAIVVVPLPFAARQRVRRRRIRYLTNHHHRL